MHTHKNDMATVVAAIFCKDTSLHMRNDPNLTPSTVDTIAKTPFTLFPIFSTPDVVHPVSKTPTLDNHLRFIALGSSPVGSHYGHVPPMELQPPRAKPEPKPKQKPAPSCVSKSAAFLTI